MKSITESCTGLQALVEGSETSLEEKLCVLNAGWSRVRTWTEDWCDTLLVSCTVRNIQGGSPSTPLDQLQFSLVKLQWCLMDLKEWRMAYLVSLQMERRVMRLYAMRKVDKCFRCADRYWCHVLCSSGYCLAGRR